MWSLWECFEVWGNFVCEFPDGEVDENEEEDLSYYKDAFKGMMRGGRACVEIDQSFWGGGGDRQRQSAETGKSSGPRTAPFSPITPRLSRVTPCWLSGRVVGSGAKREKTGGRLGRRNKSVRFFCFNTEVVGRYYGRKTGGVVPADFPRSQTQRGLFFRTLCGGRLLLGTKLANQSKQA
jgi:hypothetical protein